MAHCSSILDLGESFEELLGKSIGEIRELLAYEDAEDTFEKFLSDNGWIDSDSEDDEYSYEEDNNYEDEDSYDEEDDYDYEDEEEDTPTAFPSIDMELVKSIASDIDAGKYSLDIIRNIYPTEFVREVEDWLD